jgi:hypothetical protein
MSYDIYLCVECLGPIWFPFGDMMHLGTGWYCWRDHEGRTDGEGGKTPAAGGEFTFDTEPGRRKKLVARAVRLYSAWVADRQKARLVPFLRAQLRTGHSDVLHGFFRHLTKEPREHAGAVVREITATEEWTRFARRAVRRARVQARVQEGRRSRRGALGGRVRPTRRRGGRTHRVRTPGLPPTSSRPSRSPQASSSRP